MSGVDQGQMALQELGLRDCKETFLCSSHINDYAIIGHIRKMSQIGICSYCNKSKKVISLEELMKFMMEGILKFYIDAAEFMNYNSREGGYQGYTYTPWELINDLVGLDVDNVQLNDDIIDSIADLAWSEPNAYFDSDILRYHWDYFKDVAKHKSRYLFSQTTAFRTYSYNQNAYDILQEVGIKVKKFKLLKSIPKGTRLIRCRQHSKAERIFEAAQIAAPPLEYAVYPNRMSPAGISMFYCAFELETAKLETIDINKKGKKYFTSANFITKDLLHVIDFSALPKMPSIFDTKQFKNYYSIQFLREFVRDLSSEISHDGKEHIEYVPTQIVTEFFKYVFPKKNKVAGIVYPSAKRRGSNSCVLFLDHEQSLKELDFEHSSLITRHI